LDVYKQDGRVGLGLADTSKNHKENRLLKSPTISEGGLSIREVSGGRGGR